MQDTFIHKTAIIEGEVTIGKGVHIDAYAVISGNVTIGDGTHIGSHTVLKGNTRIGKKNKIFQFASVGEDCQDKKYKGEQTWLEIGDENNIREFTTIHRGTVQDNCLTKIGNRNLLMAYTHIGHDCIIGNDCTLANNATLGGHVILDDFVVIGGLSAVHQFCKIGKHAMIGGGTMIKKDIPAFTLAIGNPAKMRGLNLIGLKRHNFDEKRIRNLIRAYKEIYLSGKKLEQALEDLEQKQQDTPNEDLAIFLESIKTSTRGINR